MTTGINRLVVLALTFAAMVISNTRLFGGGTGNLTDQSRCCATRTRGRKIGEIRPQQFELPQ